MPIRLKDLVKKIVAKYHLIESSISRKNDDAEYTPIETGIHREPRAANDNNPEEYYSIETGISRHGEGPKKKV